MLILKEELPADAGRTGSRIDQYKYPGNWLSVQLVILWTSVQLGSAAAG